MPAVVQTAAGETMEAITTASDQFSVVAANPEVVKSFSEIASSHFFSIRALMHALDFLHSSGLTWAGAIVVLTCALRVALVPLLVYSSKVGVRLAQLRPDMEELNADFNRKKALNQDAREASVEYSQNMMALYKKHKCNPMSPMVMPLISMPMFVSCFFALTAMCTEGVAGMTTEGAFWFQDLTAKDPYFILPVLSAWSGVLVLKRGSESGGVIDPKVLPMLKVFGVLGMFAPLLTHHLPSGVLLYFSAMSVVSVFQGEIIRADATRRLIGIPTLSEMRILKSVGGNYAPFKAEGPFGGVPESLDPKGAVDPKKNVDDASKKTLLRKKPLPVPSRKR
jgi:YidC/Oxa1 family membrane protein insertase